ncbi:hypothetical protein MMC11_008704 [Xylographa trunciseda]|nr:hypothetical protein [Xylographa trunciseda]
MQLPWSSSRTQAQRNGERESSNSPVFAVFQGSYAWTNHASHPLWHKRKDYRNAPRTPLPSLNISHGDSSAPALRSPTSTRSLIDPSSSPAITARPLSTITFGHLVGAPDVPAQVYTRDEQPDGLLDHPGQRNISARFRSRPRWRPRHSRGRAFLPFMEKKGMRKRVFSCVVTGSILVITLIVFLTLAMSNTAAGQNFHVVLILFLLIFTVLFCHSLIRLGMLALQKKDARRTTRLSTNGGYAHPQEPIQVVLARDEEMGLEDDGGDEEKELPPPPPAYGLWRGSVVSDPIAFLILVHMLNFSQRIDPNLLRWQRAQAVPRHPETIQERSANRPPSYVFDNTVQRL